MLQLEQLLCLLELLSLKQLDPYLVVHDHLFEGLVEGMVIELM